MNTPDSWLGRSHQAWIPKWSLILGWSGTGALVVELVAARTVGVWPIAIATPMLVAAFVLPFLIRCRICGLRVHDSATVRRTPVWRQSAVIESLEACPVCEDDGRATAESRARWIKAGCPRERAYWSPLRLAIAILAITGMLTMLSFIRWRV